MTADFGEYDINLSGGPIITLRGSGRNGSRRSRSRFLGQEAGRPRRSLQQRAASLDEAFVVHGDTLSVPVFRIKAAGIAAKVGGLKSHHMMYNLMLISLAFEVRP